MVVIALAVEFLAGRFHANPWDRASNEGAVDWPPAPWRILRAVVAGWHRLGAEDRQTLLQLLDRLAEPPVYHLPQASTGHTRHYMPQGSLKDGREATALILDSFIAVDAGKAGRAIAYVAWPQLDLSADQRALLKRCCSLIGYLGRAESWCSIGVVDEVPSEEHLVHVDLASRVVDDGPTVRRLAAGPSLRGEGLYAALSETTAAMRKSKRLIPKGAFWVEYRLPPDFLMVREQYERVERTRLDFGPTCLRFVLEHGEHTPKPSVRDAVLFGELFRAAGIKMYSRRTGEPASLRLAGKSEFGTKREGHDHPYFLPFDSEGRGEIDGIDIWFPAGCTQQEYLAVTSISMLCERVIYSDDFPVTFIDRVDRPAATVWRSATPIILDRFPKVRGLNDSRRIVDSPAEQIETMLERQLGVPARVEVWEPGCGIQRSHGGHLRIDSFRRSRLGKRASPTPVAAATITFDRIVEGPIVLGRLAHFGLGRFEPDLQP